MAPPASPRAMATAVTSPGSLPVCPPLEAPTSPPPHRPTGLFLAPALPDTALGFALDLQKLFLGRASPGHLRAQGVWGWGGGWALPSL